MESTPPSPNPVPLSATEFSHEVEGVRVGLRGYLFSLLLNDGVTDDVFQDTLLFLWKNRRTFDPSTSFRAWAFKTAYFMALTKRHELRREKNLCYSDTQLPEIAVAAEKHAEVADARLGALERCLEELSSSDNELLRLKYSGHGTVSSFAEQSGQQPNKLHKMLSRLRLRLRLCIEKRLHTRS